MQLAELALDAEAAAGVQESAALAVARLSLLNKYKVTDVVAALCRCLLASSTQVWAQGCRSPCRGGCELPS